MVSTSDRITSPDHTNPRRRPTPEAYPQPVGFEGAVQSACRRPEFGRPSQPVDSGDSAGVVCLWRHVPLFDEFADALAVEIQEIGYALHATNGRAPLEFVDGPVRIFAGLYRQGRRHQAAQSPQSCCARLWIRLRRLDESSVGLRKAPGAVTGNPYFSQSRQASLTQHRFGGHRAEIDRFQTLVLCWSTLAWSPRPADTSRC